MQEAGVIPIIIEHVWDINPKIKFDEVYPLLHENGYLGSLAKGLLGYNGNPSSTEVMFYFLYLFGVFIAWSRISSVNSESI